jgi:hypothetical protein
MENGQPGLAEFQPADKMLPVVGQGEKLNHRDVAASPDESPEEVVNVTFVFTEKDNWIRRTTGARSHRDCESDREVVAQHDQVSRPLKPYGGKIDNASCEPASPARASGWILPVAAATL